MKTTTSLQFHGCGGSGKPGVTEHRLVVKIHGNLTLCRDVQENAVISLRAVFTKKNRALEMRTQAQSSSALDLGPLGRDPPGAREVEPARGKPGGDGFLQAESKNILQRLTEKSGDRPPAVTIDISSNIFNPANKASSRILGISKFPVRTLALVDVTELQILGWAKCGDRHFPARRVTWPEAFSISRLRAF
ncbi:hypothetical protein STEG23_035795 [Scotinomys teguina]